MKVLIMNDYLIGGGTEVQGLREKKILEKNGHNVMMITFDEKFPQSDEYYVEKNGFINIPIKNTFYSKTINSLIVNKKIENEINKVINKFQPDIIHLNNIYKASFTVYSVVGKMKSIQTVRDYAAVCPLATCIKLDGNVCDGMKYNNCYKECGKSIKNIGKILINSRNVKLRKKYIKQFVCPSEKLTKYSKDHGYNIQCLNNPFDFKKIKERKENLNLSNKKYLYYGAINEEKGIIPFIDSFIEFSKEKNVELIIAGKVKDTLKDYFFNKINKIDKIKYKGFLKYDDMMKELNEVYTIVVPSKWMENYPNTVLEGQASGILVIGSNRGGIPDMLSDEKGFIFDIDNKESIEQCLEKTYQLSKEEYNRIVIKAKKFVEYNNSFDKYYSNIMKIFNSL